MSHGPSAFSCHSHELFQPLNATFYLWPIACTLNLENATAQVLGTNQLLAYSTNQPDNGFQSPFDIQSIPSDPLVQNFGYLFNTFEAFQGHLQIASVASRFLENQLLPLLNETSAPHISSLPLDSSADRLAAFADTVSRLTCTAYALILDSSRSPPASQQDAAVWAPTKATVGVKETVLAG